MESTLFVEVDFPAVMKRKIALAKKGGLFTDNTVVDCKEEDKAIYK